MGHERFLVADRNIKFLDKTRAILSEVGIEMIAVQRGGEVEEVFLAQRPGGVLLNVDLPEVVGSDVCALLKREDATVPIVLMSIGDDPGLPELAETCRADNYLVRPLKTPEFLYCIRSMMRLRPLLKRQAINESMLDDHGAANAGIISLDLFERFLGLEVRRANRYGFPLSVLSIKVDPLPASVNREWIKALEQQLRPALSTAIRCCVREIDLSTAPDMQDTLVLMPHTDGDGAGIVAERIRNHIGNQPYHFGRLRIQPTVSVGVAATHGDQTNADELVRSAQTRRDQATTAGGNRTCMR